MLSLEKETAQDRISVGSWDLGEHRQVLFKTMKESGEKSRGPGCLALYSPPKIR